MNIELNQPLIIQALVYLLFGAGFGLLGEVVVGRPLLFNFVGSIAVAAVGAWAAASYLPFALPNEIVYQQVPLYRAALGALLATVVWLLLFGRRRRR